MTVREAIEILKEVEDQNMPVFIPIDGGFMTGCLTDSGIAKSDEGQDVFVIMPCYCFIEEISKEVTSEDFEINEN